MSYAVHTQQAHPQVSGAVTGAAASLLPFRPTAGKEGAASLDMFRLDDKVAVIASGGRDTRAAIALASPRPARASSFTDIIQLDAVARQIRCRTRALRSPIWPIPR